MRYRANLPSSLLNLDLGAGWRTPRTSLSNSSILRLALPFYSCSSIEYKARAPQTTANPRRSSVSERSFGRAWLHPFAHSVGFAPLPSTQLFPSQFPSLNYIPTHPNHLSSSFAFSCQLALHLNPSPSTDSHAKRQLISPTMNLTLEQLSADIWRQQQQQRSVASPDPKSPSPLMPAELLCATLDTLPSRQLLKLRSISPQFASSVDHILRCRMVAISTSKDYEILFTSCSPMEASRAHRQVLRLSHFEPSPTAGASEVATFTMAADPPIPQTLALDDEEAFGVHLHPP
ncbi:hypothetical protein BCR35DRAFT_52402 [Leucosporidium creatinivorum]|uniref:F-box domain-containing protein n=1 Tax=Leucosporidium creatinivorum TaxID=106004 RepID=A0A1Y2FQ22_9BASI|nr:hypothetical protein BCR35DRAFT_52402 [Leucosporidium creatinivorum]